MDQVNPNCLVVGYEARISPLTLPGIGDRHVLAAAIEAGATVIVSFNLRHFPARSLAPRGIRAMPPDVFLETIFLRNQPRPLLGIRKHRDSLKNPPKTQDEYIDSLKRQGLPKIAACLESHRSAIYSCDLHRDFRIDMVPANRMVNSKGASRWPVDEAIVLNFDSVSRYHAGTA